ncbi:hypothetical protein GQ600_20925 [Phytophthora cactorum]|nr:hypothetical protein GQ600_20925 [Phytophthora cactorum]
MVSELRNLHFSKPYFIAIYLASTMKYGESARERNYCAQTGRCQEMTQRQRQTCSSREKSSTTSARCSPRPSLAWPSTDLPVRAHCGVLQSSAMDVAYERPASSSSYFTRPSPPVACCSAYTPPSACGTCPAMAPTARSTSAVPIWCAVVAPLLVARRN